MERINLDKEPIFNPDAYTMIRGYPRRAEKVKWVEQELGAELLSDKEAGLMVGLDNALFIARVKTGEYPDYIAYPKEPGYLFVPIPFEIKHLGLTFNSWHKPAWFKFTRKFGVPAVPWKKE